MKLKAVLAMVPFALCSVAAMANPQSQYTSMKSCKESKPEYWLIEKNCPSVGGYKPRFIYDDSPIAELSLSFGRYNVSYYDNDDNTAESDFGETMEWRYTQSGGQRNYHAFIIRTYRWRIGSSSSRPNEQQLLVIRLNKGNSCVLGVIPQSANMNERARQLADNKNARCQSR